MNELEVAKKCEELGREIGQSMIKEATAAIGTKLKSVASMVLPAMGMGGLGVLGTGFVMKKKQKKERTQIARALRGYIQASNIHRQRAIRRAYELGRKSSGKKK